jgi:mRNA interferase MazF
MPKGLIVLTPFPFTDLSGHKVRPALVLYNQKGGEDCIVSFISSHAKKRTSAYDIPVFPTDLNGIKVNSIIKIDKIATLQKRIILGELGMLELPLLKEVNTRLKNLFKI